MKKSLIVAALLCVVSLGAMALGVDPQTAMPVIAMLLVGDVEAVMKSLEKVEKNLSDWSTKAEGELKTLGKVSEDTTKALDAIGVTQRELAERLLKMEQKGQTPPPTAPVDESWGAQVVKSTALKSFQEGSTQKCRIEVVTKNTLTGSDTTVAPDRKPGIVPGAFVPLTLEGLLTSVPTSSNAIEFTKENVFTNAAAEAAEGAAKAESALTWTLVNMPVSTVAHWIKISRQLAADNAALAAYVNQRMVYGVNRKVETQLVSGTGVAPALSGMLLAGNYTAHGYADAALGATLKKLVLIRKVIADLWAAGYPATAIVLNPADWAQIEIDLFTAAAGTVRVSVDELGNPRLFGLPIVQSIGMTADTFMVANMASAYTLYNRENVVVELSESDSDNFTKNLVTIRAERRLALATEVPAACRAGDLTPA
jgi:HK97 family phage major capsid protein